MVRRLLITGAGRGPANNVIHSLKIGDPSLAIVGCHDDRFVLKHSNADRNYLFPAVTRSTAFAAALRRIVEYERIDLVVPTSDTEVLAVARLRQVVPCRVFLPRVAVIALCQDKYRLTKLLRSRGVPTPATFPVKDLDTVDVLFRRLAPQNRLWCRIRAGSGSAGATPVETPEQAKGWISYWQEMRGVPVTSFTLAQYLPGRDFGCQSLWLRGNLVLIKTFERLSYIVGGGQPSGVSSVAALAKTVHEPAVVEACMAAVRALDAKASGLFSIDLREDGRGVPCVTEINAGRFLAGTNLLDLTGDHNMAVTYVRLAVGDKVLIPRAYDAIEDCYMVRDLDTLPGIFHANELFEGIEDAVPCEAGRTRRRPEAEKRHA
jgi:carbamoylphosphate synthase large subunit